MRGARGAVLKSGRTAEDMTLFLPRRCPVGVSILPGVKTGPSEARGVKLIKSRSSGRTTGGSETESRFTGTRLQLRFWQGYLRLHVDHERGRVRRPDPRAECRRRGASPSVTKTKCPSDDRRERRVCVDVSVFEVSKPKPLSHRTAAHNSVTTETCFRCVDSKFKASHQSSWPSRWNWCNSATCCI